MDRVTSTISQLFEPTTFPDELGEHVESHGADQSTADDEKDLSLHPSLSLVASGPSKAIREIPNGGLKAWLPVLGVFFVFFNTWYA